MAFKQKPPASAVQLEVRTLVQRIATETGEEKERLLKDFFNKLQNQAFAIATLEKIDGRLDHLNLKDADGWTVSFEIASYAPTPAVKKLLDLALRDRLYFELVSKEHELVGGVMMSSFALAVATLKEREESIDDYRQMAKKLKVEV